MQVGLSETLSIVIAVGIGAPLAVLWVVAIVDLMGRPAWDFPPSREPMTQRVLWASALVLLSGIAAVAYYLLVMRPYPRQHG